MLTGNRHDDIMFVYDLLSREMVSLRRAIPFPKNTDPKKTYLYRDLNRFCDSIVDPMNLDKWDVFQMIKIIVKHAKNRKILSRGSKILQMKDLLDICIKELESINKAKLETVESLKSAKRYLDSNKLNSTRALSSSNSIGGLSNLFQLVQSGLMPVHYLALSKTALRAYNMIPQSERSQLPSESRLVLLRTELLLSDRNKKIHDALGDDLYLITLVSTRSTI